MPASQLALPIQVQSPLGDDGLLLSSCTWHEELGKPFMGQLELLSADPNIDMAALLQKPIAIQIDDSLGTQQYLHGLVVKFENAGMDKRLCRYRATLAPAFGLLKATGGCRIFQDFSTLDIVKKIFADHGFSGQLEVRSTQTYATRSYCVQYAESDFHFISRLLEEEGLYYFFEYSAEKHTMVLADDLSAHRAPPEGDTIVYRDSESKAGDEYLTSLRAINQFTTGAVALNDYDFTKPKSSLLVLQNSAKLDPAFPWFDYPGRYVETDQGQRLARIRQESSDATVTRVRLSGNVRGLRSGQVFKLAGHENEALNVAFLATSTSLSIQAAGFESAAAGGFHFACDVEVQPSQLPFRTLLETPRPVMRGPQVAIVVGKAGEEIWTDQYGRVKVQFPWDREGKNDEHSSCWIRVAQSWAGKSWGSMCLPRMGEEVIVEFLDGNPDQPIITGRVFNADRMPPEALSSAQAKTVFRTRSTKGGDATTFHELTFDDTKDQESIYFHSERDFSRVVENNDSLKVGFDKQSPGDQTIEIYNDQKLTIGKGSGSGSMNVEVQKDRTVTIDSGNDTLKVTQGNWSVQISAGAAQIEAAKSIQLKCGGSTIELTPSSVQISSASITIKADGALQLHGLNATMEADAAVVVKGSASAELSAAAQTVVKGAMVMIN